MGQIQSSIGLATGINIGAMVNSLTAINAEQVNQLTTQNQTLTSENSAITQLTALLTALQGVTNNLGEASLFNTPNVSSSNSSVLSATATGTPVAGTYEFTPVQAAQAQQVISNGLASATNPLGTGTISFRQGANLTQSMSLADLNAGAGVTPGEIRITDHSGASDVIDLSTAQTVNDVLTAINSDHNIDVTATADGNSIKLTDNTGITTGSLEVQEVGGGTTAASLGLSGIDTADSSAEGTSIVSLGANLNLSALNNGNGVRMSAGLGDISYTLHDGATGTIDLATIVSGSSTLNTPTTLGQVITAFNAANPGLQMSIAPVSTTNSANGLSLQVTDTTSGSDAFTLTSAAGSSAVQDLGLTGTENNGVITGTNILAGLQGVLLSQLGGDGLGTLGTLNLTDRSGKSASVDLSGAQTLNDVIDDINNAKTSTGASLGITAQIDSSNLGIELVDTTGATTSPLIVANGDATDTATKLQIDLNDSGTAGSPTNATASSVDSGNLHQRIISNNTLLSSLNGGSGVAQGTFTVVDSAGNRGTINLATGNIQTVGQLLTAINRLPIKVTASINSTGDGIAIQDTADGSGSLQVLEGSSTTASDLHLLGAASTETVNGKNAQVINGSMTYTIKTSATDTLTSLTSSINALKAGLQASIISDGSSTPNRLSLTSQQSGTAGSWNIATTGLGLNLQQIAAGQNAMLVMGQSDSTSSSLLVSSPNGQFTSLVSGLTLQVNQGTDQPVTVSVTNSDANLANSLQSLVSDYNSFRQQLTTDTAYDPTTNTGSVLTSDYSATEIDIQLSNLMSGTFGGSSSIQSLAQVGVTYNSDGTLSFDQSTLDAAYAANPDGVQQFFTATKTGVSAQFNQLLTQLAGTNNSLLGEDAQSLQDSIANNTAQITHLNTLMTDQQNQLYTEFYNMETAISQMQADMNILTAYEDSSSTSTSSTSSGSTTSSNGLSNDSTIGNSTSS
jgi:flagellar hook-associated protein 2